MSDIRDSYIKNLKHSISLAKADAGQLQQMADAMRDYEYKLRHDLRQAESSRSNIPPMQHRNAPAIGQALVRIAANRF